MRTAEINTYESKKKEEKKKRDEGHARATADGEEAKESPEQAKRRIKEEHEAKLEKIDECLDLRLAEFMGKLQPEVVSIVKSMPPRIQKSYEVGVMSRLFARVYGGWKHKDLEVISMCFLLHAQVTGLYACGYDRLASRIRPNARSTFLLV